jgi:Zn ribbon nucleic-acid-binding protein
MSYFERCPACDALGKIDEDQLQGEVSIECSECGYHYHRDKPSGWELVLRERGKCGSCAGSLAKGYINSVMLDKYATWEFPAWGNVLARDEDKKTLSRACTFLCDTCIALMQEGKAPPIKWALEIYQENDVYKLLYHDVKGLEAAEPITEEDLE